MGWTANSIEASVKQWHVPGQCAGQIVLVEYAVDHETGDVFRRITDRSDPPGTAPRYAYAEDVEDFAPWNVEPSGEWVTVGIGQP